jgi:hypothetical protein
VFSFLSVLLLVITSTGLLISQRWRISLSLLALQYLGIFFLVLQSWPIEMAIVKLFAGWIATAVIGLMILSVRSEFEKDEIWPAGRLFRLLMVLLVIITVWSISPSAMKILPGATTEQMTGGLLLISMGLLHLSLISQPLRVIIGLFTVLGGFEIIYAATEESILVAGILAGINLVLALIGSYLLAAPVLEAEA